MKNKETVIYLGQVQVEQEQVEPKYINIIQNKKIKRMKDYS